jgi:hypothetical protein
MNIAIIITFIFSGLIFGSIALMFACCAADNKTKIWGAIISLLLGALFAFGLYFDGMAKNDAWNDGYCECGAHWELGGATRTKSGQTIKYYFCPECYAEIEQ